MSYSFNELDSLVRKAARGAGLPTGHANAIATASVWLARRQFPVCEIVSRAVLGGMSASDVDRGSNAINFRNARSAVDGPAAIDLAIAADTGTDIMLQQLDEPALLLGLAGDAADAHQIGFTISGGEQAYEVGPRAGISPGHFMLTSGSDVVLSAIANTTAGSAAGYATRYDPAAVGDAGWDDLTALAAKTYVPASDQSRLKGAGAGLTDND